MKRILTVFSTLALLLMMVSTPTFGDPQGPPVNQQQNSPQGSKQQATQGKPDVKVWVNTRSGVYHCPGTRWYGNTKSGEYMTQKEAQEKGHRPAYGKFCL
jgi:hypothetical protein